MEIKRYKTAVIYISFYHPQVEYTGVRVLGSQFVYARIVKSAID